MTLGPVEWTQCAPTLIVPNGTQMYQGHYYIILVMYLKLTD